MSLEIVPHGTHIDFIGKRRFALMVSAGLILASAIAVAVNGVQLGIDFAGGTEIQVQFAPGSGADEGQIREIAGAVPGVEDLSVVRFGDASEREFLLKFRAALDPLMENETPSEAAAVADEGEPAAGPDVVERIDKALTAGMGALTVQRVEFVGPRVGRELTEKGLLSLLWASIAILIYITVRFSSRFGPGAIVAVIHDLVITGGIFVILGMDFDLQILAAMLAILGYSLNDTIIIYDRIRENMALRTTYDLPEVLNQSVNQTLSRTVLTSGTTLLTLMCLFFLGGEMIRPFAFAMIIGVVVGTYSSIYIAAPVFMALEKRFGGVQTAVSVSETATTPTSRSRRSGPKPHPKSRTGGKRKAKKA